jgi:hypothetical protein
MTGAVSLIGKAEASRLVIANHYMHRRPPISFSYGLIIDGETKGVITFGTPASRHMLIGACPTEPNKVIELNRMWVCDTLPRNTESWFIARALALLPPRIVVSYADTKEGHMGYVYRAANFFYAGWTDMDRVTPRMDYIPAPVSGVHGLFGEEPDRQRHTREASRSGVVDMVRRSPKVRYWTTTGTRRDRKRLEALCQWPIMCWKTYPPPSKAILEAEGMIP